MMWGQCGDSGIWRASVSRRRILWRNHDALFIAFGRTRIRLMKPGRGGRPVV